LLHSHLFLHDQFTFADISGTDIDQRYYELCVLAELKNALRSGDLWVQGSRQFKDFEDYLLPKESFNVMRSSNELSIYKSYRGLRLAFQQTFLSWALSTPYAHLHSKVSGLNVLKFPFREVSSFWQRSKN
jgi:hypothetical protein